MPPCHVRATSIMESQPGNNLASVGRRVLAAIRNVGKDDATLIRSTFVQNGTRGSLLPGAGPLGVSTPVQPIHWTQ